MRFLSRICSFMLFLYTYRHNTARHPYQSTIRPYHVQSSLILFDRSFQLLTNANTHHNNDSTGPIKASLPLPRARTRHREKTSRVRHWKPLYRFDGGRVEMAQARIVLKNERLDLANDLLAHTRISNLSELMGVMLTRYSKHMAETWEVEPTRFESQEPSSQPPSSTATTPSKTRPNDGDLFL